MQSTLVLGIGNNIKSILQPLELQFPAYTFAILDEWSVVQEWVIEDEKIDGVTFIRDLSYFVEKPRVSIRFDHSKYLDAQTQKLAPIIPEHRLQLRQQLATCLPPIVEEIKPFDRIIIATYMATALAVEWLVPLVQELPFSSITLLAYHPASFEGTMITNMASMVCEQLMDTPVTQYAFFRQDLALQMGQETLEAFRLEADRLQSEALSNLLLGNVPESEYVSVI